MKTKIIAILKQADFSQDFISYIEQQFPITYQKQFQQPYHVDYLENPILNLAPAEAVFESLAQLLDLKDFYEEKGIELRHFYASIYDLSFRLERYKTNYDKYGLSASDLRWLSPLYKGEIFDLGSLRYQMTHFSNQEIERQTYQYMPLSDKWKERFPEGTPIIMIHILKDTDFRPEKIDESLKLARDFFARYFPTHNYEIFLCRTWLIYRPTHDLLRPDSNIVSFSKRFEIIAENRNTKQALDRIYGTSNLAEIEKMDKRSSLEKIAYQHLDKLGVAAGIIYK